MKAAGLPPSYRSNVEAALAGHVGEHVPLVGDETGSEVLGEHALLLGDLVPPETVLVAASEAGDHNGDGESQDENTSHGTQPIDQFAGFRVEKTRNIKLSPPQKKKSEMFLCI